MDAEALFERLADRADSPGNPVMLINFKNGGFSGDFAEDAIGASQMFYGFSASAAERIADILEGMPEWMRRRITSFKIPMPPGVDFEPVNINPENFGEQTLRAAQFSKMADSINENEDIASGFYHLVFYPGMKCVSLHFELKNSSDAISVDFSARELREMAARLKAIERQERGQRRGPTP